MQEKKVSSNKILSGMLWAGLDRCGTYGFNFIMIVILSRLLGPREYGEMALVNVVVGFFYAFIDGGMGMALIQKKDMDELDCNSMFYLNIVTGLFLYTILFFSASWIAGFYHLPKMIPYLRVLGIYLLLAALYNVQRNLLVKRLLFRFLFGINLASLVISAFVGLTLALLGYGTWALIWQLLSRNIVYCILYWVFVYWRPAWQFSFQRLKILFSFSWKLLCSGILNSVYSNIYGVIFGKLYDISTLSFYDKGRHIPEIATSSVTNSITGVLFPVMAEMQDEPQKIRALMQNALQNVAFLLLPGLALLAVIAHPLFYILYGEKWLPAVPYVRIFCVYFIFFPLLGINSQVVMAKGRTDLMLIQEIINKVVILIVIVCCYRWGAIGLTWGGVVINLIDYIIKSWPCKKLIDYSMFQQVADLKWIFLNAVCSGGIVYSLLPYLKNCVVQILMGSLLFAVFYLGFAYLFHMIPNTLLELLKKKFYKHA